MENSLPRNIEYVKISNKKVIHNFYPFLKTIRHLFKGHSLTRVLFNLSLEKLSINGNVLDLGSKNIYGSYYSFININSDTNIIFTDLEPNDENVVKLNVEKRFPFEDNSFDYCLAFNLLEHVYKFENVFEEVYRVLKKDGYFYLYVPFAIPYHPDPDDFFRYTFSALYKLSAEKGFKIEYIEAVSSGILTTLMDVLGRFIPNNKLKILFRVIGYSLLFPIELFINKLTKRYSYEKIPLFPLGYLAVLKK